MLSYDTKALIKNTCINKNDITYLVDVGLLHPIKLNNRYIYTRKDVERCLDLIEGMEIKTKKAGATNTDQVALDTQILKPSNFILTEKGDSNANRFAKRNDS